MKNFLNGVGGFNLKLEKEPEFNEIIAELENVINRRNWHEIVFCGFGEPLERLDCVLEVSRWIRKHYGKIVTLRVDTNGQALLLLDVEVTAVRIPEVDISKVEQIAKEMSVKFRVREYIQPFW